jgi:hypothetical protein
VRQWVSIAVHEVDDTLPWDAMRNHLSVRLNSRKLYGIDLVPGGPSVVNVLTSVIELLDINKPAVLVVDVFYNPRPLLLIDKLPDED